MNFNFLKNRQGYIKVDADGNEYSGKKSKFLIIAVLIAIVLFIFSGTGGEKKEEKAETSKALAQPFSTTEYIKETEKRLEEVLSNVQGAGKVRAMVTVENLGEKVLAQDKNTENTEEKKTEESSKTIKQEQKSVICDMGDEEKPFVIKENLPMPSGILIVASGAGDESVRFEIYEAVKALYGVSGHRIKVTKGNFK